MVSISNEYQLQLTFQTFEKDFQFNIYEAVRFYNILHSILSTQINSVFTYIITIVNSQKLTILKEEIIVRKVFDLNSQKFPLRIHNIKDIINRLLTIYDAIHIGPH